jgi:hypothetical protein
MKYCALFTFLFIGLAWPGLTQLSPSEEFNSKLVSDDKRKTEFQIFAGPSVSFLRGNLEVDNTEQNERDPKYGYSLGFAFSTELKGRVSITYGLMFEKKGSISNATVTYFDELDQTFKQGLVEYDYEYDYFTFPIQLFYQIGSTEKLYAGFGPYLSYLKKQTKARNPSFSPARELTDETELNTKFNFGIITTVFFKIPLSTRNSLSLHLTNTLGLINIRPNLYTGQVMKTNCTSLLIGLTNGREKRE